MLYQPIVGERTWRWLMSGEPPALGRMVGQWLANVIATLDGVPGSKFQVRSSPQSTWNLEPGTWNSILPEALDTAWQAAVAKGGPDPAAWRWADHHGTNAKHTLAGAFPEFASRLNPPRAFIGGDGDTIQCASYGWSGRADFDITGLSVYRQAVNLGDIVHGSFVVPAGVSGQPGTPHFADQLELWREHRRIPMHFTEADVAASARHTLTLRA